MKIFDLKRINAIKVQFKKQIFEEDFPEKGMTAWLTDIIEVPEGCYKLFFDFEEFFDINKKYFKALYFDNNKIPCLTAIEAGFYTHKYTVYFGDSTWSEEKLDKELKKYLKYIGK